MTYIAEGGRTLARDDILLGSLSHVGMERTENQDFCGFYEPEDERILELKGRLFVVCDGMGGHAGGEIASRMGVEKIIEAYYLDPGSNTLEAIKHSVELSSRGIWDKAQEQPALRGMGSTSVVAVIKNNMAYFGHVGDSRAYIIRGGRIEQITKDHSLVQQMVDEGLIDPSEMENHPDKNVILRSMGVKPEVECDLLYHPIEVGDLYILCTDGLSGLVSDDEILNITLANEHNPQEACQRLVDLANAYGGYDNTTVQIVRINRIRQGPPPSDMTTGVFTPEQVQASIAKARADMGHMAPPPKALPEPGGMVKTQPSMEAPRINQPSTGRIMPQAVAPAAVPEAGSAGGGKFGYVLAVVFALLFVFALILAVSVQSGVAALRIAMEEKASFYGHSGGLAADPNALKDAEQALEDGANALTSFFPWSGSKPIEDARKGFDSLGNASYTDLGIQINAVENSLVVAKSLANKLEADEHEASSRVFAQASKAEKAAGEDLSKVAKLVKLREAEAGYHAAADLAAKAKASDLKSEVRDLLEKAEAGVAASGDRKRVLDALKVQRDAAERAFDAEHYIPAYFSLVQIEKILTQLTQ